MWSHQVPRQHGDAGSRLDDHHQRQLALPGYRWSWLRQPTDQRSQQQLDTVRVENTNGVPDSRWFFLVERVGVPHGCVQQQLLVKLRSRRPVLVHWSLDLLAFGVSGRLVFRSANAGRSEGVSCFHQQHNLSSWPGPNRSPATPDFLRPHGRCHGQHHHPARDNESATRLRQFCHPFARKYRGSDNQWSISEHRKKQHGYHFVNAMLLLVLRVTHE